jgi:iron complex outermembrane receptor protein/vitamin B12 transporter
MGIKSIYAAVISQPSLDLLTENGVDVVYDELVPAIRNRDNTGFCPIESAVTGIDNLQDALVRIRKRTAELAKG